MESIKKSIVKYFITGIICMYLAKTFFFVYIHNDKSRYLLRCLKSFSRLIIYYFIPNVYSLCFDIKLTDIKLYTFKIYLIFNSSTNSLIVNISISILLFSENTASLSPIFQSLYENKKEKLTHINGTWYFVISLIMSPNWKTTIVINGW